MEKTQTGLQRKMPTSNRLLLLDSPRALHQVLVGRVASRPAVETDSVNVAGIGLAGEQAVDLGLGIHVQFISELRRRQAEDGFVRGGAQVKVVAQRFEKQRGDDLGHPVQNRVAIHAQPEAGVGIPADRQPIYDLQESVKRSIPA